MVMQNGFKDMNDVVRPFPGSRKVYVQGSRSDVRVPMREVELSPTRHSENGAEEQNPSAQLYDTTGPYTDPDARIDIREGLKALRLSWVLERGDVQPLSDISSEYGRRRAADPRLNGVRFPNVRKPLRAVPGGNVTQMYYARKSSEVGSSKNSKYCRAAARHK